MSVRFAVVVGVQLAFGSVAMALEPIPLIVTPAEGTPVIAGTQMVVHVDSEVPVGRMRVRLFGKGITTSELSGIPPFDFTITAPWEVTGPLPLAIDAVSVDDATKVIRHTALTRTLFAQPSPGDSPSSLNLGPAIELAAPYSGQIAETKSLNPIAVYGDGRQREVSWSGVGTAYAVSDPAVVSVTGDGLVSAVAQGIAFVRVDYKNASGFVKVKVTDPATGFPPVLDYTALIPVYKSGIRRDSATGLYVQQLSFTNNTGWPIPKPVSLVLSGLPTGVALPDYKNTTRRVEPVGSSVVRVKSNLNDDFLPPGTTASVLLKFEDPDNLPITYSLQLVAGAIP